MSYVIHGYRPEKLFRYFEDLAAIPHGSGNESAVADWLEGFARERSLDCVRDEWNNVLIRLPASEGREEEPALLLQGHTDMVCEKNRDTVHDFTKDGLKLAVCDGWLHAEGTTLGGDDGIAVATMMTILDGGIASHPAIECLFTVAEETGLIGAGNFDYSLLRARRMINLDNEELGILIAGCAGGIRSEISLPINTVPCALSRVEIQVKGLCGGHSGGCIHMGRANANKLMARILLALHGAHAFRLVSVEGGSKDNAIPRECRAVIATDAVEESLAFLAAYEKTVAAELGEEDRAFHLETAVSSATATDRAMDTLATSRMLAFLSSVQDGVMAMSHDVPGLVEYSRNLGVVSMDTELCRLNCVVSTRSAIEAQIDASVAQLDALASMLGGKTRHHSRYPGWNYEKDSAIREKYLESYRRVMGKDVEVTIIHAGLECGIIKNHLPDMDAISVGPDMQGIHSPDERMDLASCEKFWQILVSEIEG
ncbi:MAG: aminoacyl-histidine dipeptidase [Clostridia bacterium]|nr:aminoacyl-histidine dipeptidase [Clostridia bacterium]